MNLRTKWYTFKKRNQNIAFGLLGNLIRIVYSIINIPLFQFNVITGRRPYLLNNNNLIEYYILQGIIYQTLETTVYIVISIIP